MEANNSDVAPSPTILQKNPDGTMTKKRTMISTSMNDYLAAKNASGMHYASNKIAQIDFQCWATTCELNELWLKQNFLSIQ